MKRLTIPCWLLLAATTMAYFAPADAQELPLNSAVTAAASQTSQVVLARVRPTVIQIKGFFGTNTAQAFHGTGFAVKEGGLFMTNYHVVAETIHHPGKYRLEYRTAEGKTGKITVLAIDVRHDLALVRAKGHSAKPLTIATSPQGKGQRAFSVGFPLDVGLTITEGVSNGKIEDSFDPRIHYSGALNGGMSGGPALNADGQVIGVNVAGYRFSQLVSFLVPPAHAIALHERPVAAPPTAEALQKEVTRQMRDHSDALLQQLNGPGPMVTQKSAGYILPAKLASFVDCSATGSLVRDDPVQMTSIRCSAKAGLYLQQGLSSGNIKYKHRILTTSKLDAWRFAYRLSNFTSVTGVFGRRKYVGPFACREKIVALKGFDAGVIVCARAYRKLAGLYDFTVRVSSLNSSTAGFISHLDMWGLKFDGGMTFIRRYLQAMEWKP